MNFPCYENGQRINATSSSQAHALAGALQRVMSARDLLLHNPGPNIVYLRAGGPNVTADDTCAPLPGGALWAYGKGPHTHLAVYAPDGDQNILAILGEGA